jgi:formylmethanofuran dehydrogenase subunit A
MVKMDEKLRLRQSIKVVRNELGRRGADELSTACMQRKLMES